MKTYHKKLLENDNWKIQYYDKIIAKNIDIRSHAHLILLNEHYRTISKNEILKINIELKKQWKKFREVYINEYQKIHSTLICQYCNKNLIYTLKCSDVNKPNYTTLDHIIPLSNGGKQFDPKNILLSCRECNNSKNDKDELEYRLLLLKNCLCQIFFNHQLDIFSNYTYQLHLLVLLKYYIKCWIKKLI